MEFASGTGTQSSAQNNARARIIEQSSNAHMPVWRAAADMVSTSSWTPDGAQDGSWPTTQAESITAAEVIRRIKEIQDQFRDELTHMRHDEQRCKTVQWYLDHAVQLQKGGENGVFTAQEALDEIPAIKVWSWSGAYQDYQNQAKARYVNATLRPRKVMRRSEEVVDDREPSEASTTSYHMRTPVYAPTEGTETKLYNLSNITHSPISECDMPGSDDNSTAGSPGCQSTDSDDRLLQHDCTW